MDSKIILKVFRETVNKFKTKKMTWRVFVENYFFFKKKVFHIEYSK